MIESAALSGDTFSDVEVTRSGQFIDLHDNMVLPNFWWMMVGGKPKVDDFGLSEDLMLIASERALDILRQSGLVHAEILPIAP